jgi:hypothetical protein
VRRRASRDRHPAGHSWQHEQFRSDQLINFTRTVVKAAVETAKVSTSKFADERVTKPAVVDDQQDSEVIPHDEVAEPKPAEADGLEVYAALITCVWVSALVAWWFSAANQAGESPQQLNTFTLTQELLFVGETAKYIYEGVLDALRRAAGENSA